MLRAKYIPLPLPLPKLLRAMAKDRNGPSLCLIGKLPHERNLENLVLCRQICNGQLVEWSFLCVRINLRFAKRFRMYTGW